MIVPSVLAAALGCNGPAGGVGTVGASCQPLQACGGKLDGTWHATSLCYDIDSLMDQQPSDPACQDLIRRFDAHASGTITFSDGKMTDDLTISIDVEAVWTADCLRAVAGTSAVNAQQTCLDIESSYQTGGVFQSASCSVMGTDCVCRAQSAPTMDMTSGAYNVQGNDLVDESGARSPYCVQGNTLTMGFMASDGSISGQFVLSR